MDKSIFISLGVLIALVIMISAASVMPPPPRTPEEPQQYAVIFKPSFDFRESFKTIINSGGMPISYGLFDFIVISASAAPDYARKLYESGAWLVFDPVIKGGCYKKDDTPLKVSG